MPNARLKRVADGKSVNIPILTVIAKEGRRRLCKHTVGIVCERE